MKSGLQSEFSDSLFLLETNKTSGMSESFKTTASNSASLRKMSAAVVLPGNYVVANTRAKLAGVADHIRSAKRMVLDTETSDTDPWRCKLYCISLWVGDLSSGKGYLIPIEHQMMTCVDIQWVRDDLGWAFSDPAVKRGGHNYSFDLHVIEQQAGIPVGPAYFDSLLQAQVIDSNTFVKKGLKHLTTQYSLGSQFTESFTSSFGKTAWSYLDPKLATAYAISDAESTLKLYLHQYEMLKQTPRVKRIYDEIEVPFYEISCNMTRRGVRVDWDYYNSVLRPSIYKKYDEAVAALAPYLEKHLSAVGAESMEKLLETPAKLCTIFFDLLEQPVREVKNISLLRDKRGDYASRSLAKVAIENLSEECPALVLLGNYRKVATIKKLFVDQLPGFVVGDVIHPTIVSMVSNGRMSMRRPNLLQCPRGPLIRNMFIPREGNTFISYDYSGQELRLLSHECGDEAMRAVFQNKDPSALDMYSVATMAMFPDGSFDKEEFRRLPKDLRKKNEFYTRGKSTVLGCNYGMQAAKLARTIRISKKAAQAQIDGLFSAFPGIPKFQTRIKEFARKHGYVESLCGRRRYLPHINNQQDSGLRTGEERSAINHRISGSAADQTKLGAIKVHRLITANNWPLHIVMSIHDEVLLEGPTPWLQANKQAVQQIKETMEAALPLSVPVVCEPEFESRWGSHLDLTFDEALSSFEDYD